MFDENSEFNSKKKGEETVFFTYYPIFPIISQVFTKTIPRNVNKLLSYTIQIWNTSDMLAYLQRQSIFITPNFKNPPYEFVFLKKKIIYYIRDLYVTFELL